MEPLRPLHRLGYASPPRCSLWSKRMPWQGWLAVLLLGIGTAIVALPGPQVESQVDAVTGSLRSTTDWLGWRSTRTQGSPLEACLKQRQLAWSPAWQTLHVTEYNLSGRVVKRECGIAPPIYSLRPLLTKVVAHSTDAELLSLVRSLQTGTTAEQEAAVNAVADRIVQTSP